MHRTRTALTRLALALPLLALTALLAPPAAAHSELDSSSPAQGQTVNDLPEQITLTFNQQIAPEFAAVSLRPRGGAPATLEVVVRGEVVTAQVSGEVRRTAAAGGWRVSYRVTSADGHPIEGSVDFTVRAPAPDPATAAPTGAPSGSPSVAPSTTPSTTPADSPQPTSTGSNWTSTLVIGAIAAVATIGALVGVKRRGGSQ